MVEIRNCDLSRGGNFKGDLDSVGLFHHLMHWTLVG